MTNEDNRTLFPCFAMRPIVRRKAFHSNDFFCVCDAYSRSYKRNDSLNTSLTVLSSFRAIYSARFAIRAGNEIVLIAIFSRFNIL